MKTTLTRRDFAKTTFAAAVAPMIVPSSVLGMGGAIAPSERIVMGGIGIGGMGRLDMGNLMTQPDVQFVAVCDVDAQRREFAKGTVDQHYGTKDCAAYNNFEEILGRDDIDAVLIATPDHWHAYLAIAAARAGKDIYCEKPISLTVEQGRQVVKVMKETGRIYQSGTQRRSIPCFRFAVDAAREGKVGKLHTIHVNLDIGKTCPPQQTEPIPSGLDYERWLGPAPDAPYTTKRCHGSFRWIYDYSGGQLTDIGAHFLDLAQWGHDSQDTGPIHYEGFAEFPRQGLFNTPVHYMVMAHYADGVRLIYNDDLPRTVRFEGDEGWISVNDDGIVEAEPKSLLEGSGFETQSWVNVSYHHRNFLDCVKSRETPIAPPEVAHRSTTLCHIGNICLRLGRALEWDPSKERFVKDKEANKMLSRPSRAPWRIEA